MGAYFKIQVTLIALSDTLSPLAIGHSNGVVILYRCLDQPKLSASTSLTSIPTPCTTNWSQSQGCALESASLYLFIVKMNRVISHPATRCGPGKPPCIIHEASVGLRWAVMVWHERDIVVAKEEALFICAMENMQFSHIRKFLLLS